MCSLPRAATIVCRRSNPAGSEKRTQVSRPEWINAHAQAVIRTLRAEAKSLGCLPVQSIAAGKLIFPTQQAGELGRVESRYPIVSRERFYAFGRQDTSKLFSHRQARWNFKRDRRRSLRSGSRKFTKFRVTPTTTTE